MNTIKNRIEKLEAKRPQDERVINSRYTAVQQQKSMDDLAAALGDILSLDPVDVKAKLPEALAGIGGGK